MVDPGKVRGARKYGDDEKGATAEAKGVAVCGTAAPTALRACCNAILEPLGCVDARPLLGLASIWLRRRWWSCWLRLVEIVFVLLVIWVRWRLLHHRRSRHGLDHRSNQIAVTFGEARALQEINDRPCPTFCEEGLQLADRRRDVLRVKVRRREGEDVGEVHVEARRRRPRRTAREFVARSVARSAGGCLFGYLALVAFHLSIIATLPRSLQRE